MAALTWWRADLGGYFVLLGLPEPWSEWLGPLLPALSAGLSAMLVFSLADIAVGRWTGVLAVLAMLALPVFLPVHVRSLVGPPLLVIVLLQLAVMLHAPRFSIAYGGLAAVAAVAVSSAALGLPVAATIWAVLKGGRNGDAGPRSPQRAVLALATLAVVTLLAHWTGAVWLPEEPRVRPGWLGDGLMLGGMTLLGQLVPGHPMQGPWLVLAVGAGLALLGVGVAAWRQVAAQAPGESLRRDLYPAAGLLLLSLAVGLVLRLLWSGGGALPDAAALLPLVAIAMLLTVVSISLFWRDWSPLVRGSVMAAVAGWLLLGVLP